MDGNTLRVQTHALQNVEEIMFEGVKQEKLIQATETLGFSVYIFNRLCK